MNILICAPALLCVAGLFYWGVQKTFLNLCLPIMLLLPTYFYWKVDGFPDLDFSTAVLLPLGASLIPLASRWKFTRSDLWMLVYIVSNAIADFRLGETSLAKYRLFGVIVAALIPYMAARLLIEQAGARFEIAKRIILILCLSCLVAIPEAFLKMNLFSRVGMHIFPDQWPGWTTQLRGGLGRVAGPYGTAEVYGLILILGVFLLLWVRPSSTPSLQQRWIPSRRTIHLSLLLLLLTLWLTQSRGPWLGAIIALPISLIGRAKHVRRTALLVALVLVSIAVPVYIKGDSYTSGARHNYGSEQETAQYRRELLVNYLPVAEKGGLWGWGTFHPILNGQTSIDNEFLRVFLVQGYVGVVSYMLLILEAGYALVRKGFASPPGQDRYFCFTLLGILAGWTVTLCTVYMGAQSYELFFLLVGWTQAIQSSAKVRASQPASVAILQAKEPIQAKEPALTRVYT